MATIERESIRAKIYIGDLEISTPYVKSFNVRKSRGQMSATFSATLQMDSDTMMDNATSLVSQEVIIEAGVKGRERQIFKGTIRKVTVNPVRTDASKVNVSLSGRDLMGRMEGQKINRRIKTYRDGETPPERWGVVTMLEEDNTPVKTGFSYKHFNRNPMAALDLGELATIFAPQASIKSDPLKERPSPIGSITAQNVTEEE